MSYSVLCFMTYFFLYILTTSSGKIHHPPATYHIIFTSATGWGPEKGHFWNLNCCWLGTVLFPLSAFHSCWWPNSWNCSLHTWHIFMSIGQETKDCHQHFDEPHGVVCKDCETWSEAQASSAQWGTSPLSLYNLASWGDPYQTADPVDLHKSDQNEVNWESWPDHLNR